MEESPLYGFIYIPPLHFCGVWFVGGEEKGVGNAATRHEVRHQTTLATRSLSGGNGDCSCGYLCPSPLRCNHPRFHCLGLERWSPWPWLLCPHSFPNCFLGCGWDLQGMHSSSPICLIFQGYGMMGFLGGVAVVVAPNPHSHFQVTAATGKTNHCTNYISPENFIKLPEEFASFPCDD